MSNFYDNYFNICMLFIHIRRYGSTLIPYCALHSLSYISVLDTTNPMADPNKLKNRITEPLDSLHGSLGKLCIYSHNQC